MNLYNGKIGAEGNLSIDLVQGNLSVAATENTAGFQAEFKATLPLTYFVDAGAQKLNSPIVTAIASIVDGALKTIG